MTLSKTNMDYYDIEVINGIHMSVSMEADNVESTGPYDCGAPGAHNPKSDLFGMCSWGLNPPSEDYQWVEMGGNPCQSSSDCSTGTCGISFNPGHNPLLQKTCGHMIGYWTADQVCGITPDYGAPFDCQQYWNLYACVGGLGSCYQPGADSTCCGCANWWEDGIKVPDANYTQVCKNQNPIWEENIKPKL